MSSSPDIEKVPTNETSDTVVAHGGVKTVEASHKVYGRFSKWFLFVSLALAAYIYSLDGTTTWNYLAFATSSFGHHSLISAIQVAQSIIVSVGKPVIAKAADVSSRGTAFSLVLLFYVVGYIVIASAKSANTVAGGIVIYAVGNTGLQLLTQIIIADITTLKWRGLVSGLISAPFIINAFVAPNIAAGILKGAGWRWGYGMFAILVPVALAPLIITLLWAERKAKKMTPAAQPTDSPKEPLLSRILLNASKMDLIGLLLIGASIALILIPLTLTNPDTNIKGQVKSPSQIAMLVVGCILFPVYIIWDTKFASYPVVPKRFITNRTFIVASLVGLFDFVSFYISYTFLYSFILVVKPWPLLHASYFANTQTVALTIFGITAGVLMRFVHRSKPILIAGLAIRLLGAGLMVHSRGANASDAEIVWSQILQGMGGGFAAIAAQVSAQASVPHADVAMITAVVLLFTEVGGAIGNAISGAIWAAKMPSKLAHYLPQLSQSERDKLFGSIVAAAAQPRGDPIREGVISAYDDVMKLLTIAATVVAVVPLVLACLMPNWYLGDQQNAVDNVDLSGEKVHNADEDEKGGL